MDAPGNDDRNPRHMSAAPDDASDRAAEHPSPAPAPSEIWRRVLDRLRRVVPAPSFDTWFADTHAIGMQGGVLQIGVVSDFAREALTAQYYPAISEALTSVVGRRQEFELLVHRQQETGAPAQAMPPSQSVTAPHARPVLAPHYTFANFVVGRSNRLAHAAAVAVSEQPSQSPNPLFIYGGVGLGKTHLLHAIAHVTGPRLRTIYVSAETYTNEFVTALREHSMEQFREKYRNVDILLIDDIQFISRGEQTQEEFFHTFDALYTRNKQIVINSDVSPKLLTLLEERLRSRFEWGLTVDISAPDVETRLAILRSKAERDELRVPEEVLLLIAHRVQDNIRQLEGALNRIAALARLQREPITRELAVDALNAITSTPRTAVPMPSVILDAVAQVTNIPVDALTSKRREKQVAYARHLAMYLLRDVAHQSYAQIGRILGGRDHTTVLHGFRRIDRLLETDPDVRRDLTEIRAAMAAR
ncbi:MAG: chromosomal replication initiator protein [Chloroflexi bacterium]|nr:MAG: chromosomal replication initiator protein [Chloroflexota bacterium]